MPARSSPASEKVPARHGTGPDRRKQPFDIDRMLQRIGEAVAPYPRAALFELAEEGYVSTFEQLAACMLSIRTLDEVMLTTARRLFAVARTPEEIDRLGFEELDSLIRTTSFHEAKARQLKEIARRTLEEYGGELPCDREVLLSLPGIGPKCANLIMGIACGEPYIAVDVHVHRVTNRWGYVQASTPEKTMGVLEELLPRKHWVEINRLLVPFGKHVCTGKLPRCSTCPVLEYCRQVGVTAHR